MRLKELRKERKLNQRDIADVLNCSQSVYSRYENGSYEPPIDVLIRLADFYQITLDELVGRTPMTVTVTHGDPPPLDGDQLEMVFTPDDLPKDPDDIEQRMRRLITEELKKRGL